MGPGYRLDNIIDNFDNHYIVKEYLNNLKVIPDYFIVEYAGDKTLDKYNYLKKKMIELYPKIIVKNIKPYRYSTGSACIQYALENNVNNIYLSGYMDWLNSEYKYNSDFASIDLYKNKNLKILHGEEDKKYIKLLKKSDKKKIITNNKEMKKFLI